MPPARPRQRLGFFTRLLDQASPAERYRLGTEQIVHAEALGFDAAWVAQHHFHEAEGGLPGPFVFLAHVAARTSRIRLGTAIITLPLELPIRVAEDASVLDIMSGGRLEVGVAPGGNLSMYTAFGLDSNDRHALMTHHLDLMRDAWAGRPLPGGDSLYPVNPGLADRIWQATFAIEGAQRAGRAGDGLMLSRNQPRAQGPGRLSLDQIQNPLIDAYLEALPQGREPRILASRTVFVADDRKDALRHCETGIRGTGAKLAGVRRLPPGCSIEEAVALLDIHTGSPEDVIASLQADSALARATDWTVQVHSIDPPHSHILRSIELIAQVVAPALGWQPAAAAGVQ
ncbi:MAG: putative FMN-dependent luciferase-like monooxygenase [Burkholderiales bacterium]